MKKLMIVAAIAAMAGGAIADTAYTFSATLKTTKGKSGKTTATYYLGENADGAFWYDDAAVVALTNNAANAAYFTTKKIGRKTVLALSSAAKKDNAWLSANIVDLAATYNEKSAGKWCETFKVTEEGCYRVAGTEKIKDVFVGDLCCAELTGVESSLVLSATDGLVQRFGGLTYAKAKKAEIVATVGDDADVALVLAGQGSIGKVLDNTDGETVSAEGVTSLSGNIVGILPAPKCEYCCSPDQDAVAFVCGTEDDGDPSLKTAAYGTFSIKYNAKATKDL